MSLLVLYKTGCLVDYEIPLCLDSRRVPRDHHDGRQARVASA